MMQPLGAVGLQQGFHVAPFKADVDGMIRYSETETRGNTELAVI